MSPKYTSEQEDPVQGSLEQQIFIEHLLLTIRLKMSIILRKTGIAGGILCKIKILSPYDSYLNLFLGNSTGLWCPSSLGTAVFTTRAHIHEAVVPCT